MCDVGKSGQREWIFSDDCVAMLKFFINDSL